MTQVEHTGITWEGQGSYDYQGFSGVLEGLPGT